MPLPTKLPFFERWWQHIAGGIVNFGGHRGTNAADPTGDQDVATKKWSEDHLVQKEIVAKGPAYWFDKVDDKIDFGALSLGTIYSGVVCFQMDDITKDSMLIATSDSDYGVLMGLNPTGDILYTSDDNEEKTVAYTAWDTDWHTFIVSRDGVSIDFYIDGLQVGSTQTFATNGAISPDNIGARYNNANLRIFSGPIAIALIFNLTLTAAEALAYSNGAPVPYKYIGASQTVINTENWANNGNGDFDYDNFGGASATGFTADTVSVNGSYVNLEAVTDFPKMVGGKRYRLTYDLTINSGTAPNIKHNVGTAASVGLGLLVAGTGKTAEFTLPVGAANLYISHDSGTTADFELANMSLIQIGCVLQLEQDSITDAKWFDKSGNNLDGTVSGAVAINTPDTFQVGILAPKAGGIAFPATAVPSADPNTCDDYEEGTWDMDLQFGDAKVGITYTYQAGTYTVNGRAVVCTGYMLLTSKGSSNGDADIFGLPFTNSGVSGIVAASLVLENISFANQYGGQIIHADTRIALWETTEGGTMSTLTDANFADNSGVMVGFTYNRV
ncbi:MAG: LamG domain-containing protein [Candidatus Bathyarchaeota archaeon]|nr:LamG domain-containing protein [Candidatus Bathyarchaeota archaeon]